MRSKVWFSCYLIYRFSIKIKAIKLIKLLWYIILICIGDKMRLIVKVLIISSLISSNFVSCKLYEKLVDKKEEPLDNKGEYLKKIN